MMKLLFTIIQDQDAPDLLNVLMESGFRATRLASTGGGFCGPGTPPC